MAQKTKVKDIDNKEAYDYSEKIEREEAKFS